MKLARTFLMFLFFATPFFSRANFRIVELPTPSGLLVWTVQLLAPARAQAKEITQRGRYIAHIYAMASKHGADAEKMIKTIGGPTSNCPTGESNFVHYRADGSIIRGKAGETGLGQYMYDTWIGWEIEFDRADLSLYNDYDQLEMMAIAFAHGYQKHWTCAWYI